MCLWSGYVYIVNQGWCASNTAGCFTGFTNLLPWLCTIIKPSVPQSNIFLLNYLCWKRSLVKFEWQKYELQIFQDTQLCLLLYQHYFPLLPRKLWQHLVYKRQLHCVTEGQARISDWVVVFFSGESGFVYSGTSIMRTPLVLPKVSWVKRCPDFGGFRYISGRRCNAYSCCWALRRSVPHLSLAVR